MKLQLYNSKCANVVCLNIALLKLLSFNLLYLIVVPIAKLFLKLPFKQSQLQKEL